jgi:hypothetical protein
MIVCVPLININGESYRLKDKRKAGLLAASAKRPSIKLSGERKVLLALVVSVNKGKA